MQSFPGKANQGVKLKEGEGGRVRCAVIQPEIRSGAGKKKGTNLAKLTHFFPCFARPDEPGGIEGEKWQWFVLRNLRISSCPFVPVYPLWDIRIVTCSGLRGRGEECVVGLCVKSRQYSTTYAREGGGTCKMRVGIATLLSSLHTPRTPFFPKV